MNEFVRVDAKQINEFPGHVNTQMAKVLAISSLVTRDRVGLNATNFVLERLRHDVWAIPTIILSNHPGHQHCAGQITNPDDLHEMLKALQANTWLPEIAAVLTGYFPTPEHVNFAMGAINTIRQARQKMGKPEPIVLCDPILGDDGKGLYIEKETAEAIRATLVPEADIVTPNCFELSWLTGAKVTDLQSAVTQAMSLSVETVIATSIPSQDPNSIENLLVTADTTCHVAVPTLKNAPHGIGDFFAANILGHLLSGKSRSQALGSAAAAAKAVLMASTQSDQLEIIKSQEEWIVAKPLQPTPYS